MNGAPRPALRLSAGPGGIRVFWGERALLGLAPLRTQTRRLPTDPQHQTLYLIVSPLFGDALRPLLEVLPRSSAIVVIELEPALSALWNGDPTVFSPLPEGINPPPRSPALRFSTSVQEALHACEALIAERVIRRTERINLSGGARLHQGAYRDIETGVDDLIQRFWRNRGVEVRLGRRWIGNIWRNCGTASGDFAHLAVGLPEKAILIGAGPSLDIDLPLLEQVLQSGVRNGLNPIARPLVVALDTALPALAERTVPVDIVVAMDSQLANAIDLVPWRWNDAILLADVTVHPSIVRMFSPDRRFLFASRFTDAALFRDPSIEPLAGILDGITVIPPRGSVAPAAVELLVRHLGVSELVLAGIDFWYRPPQSHAKMTATHRRFLDLHDRLGGTDGPAAVVNRPWRPGSLRDGTCIVADEILMHHAEQLRSLVNTLTTVPDACRIHQLHGVGLEVGAQEMPTDTFRNWAIVERWSPSQTVHAADRGINARGRRVAALRHTIERLRAQEHALQSPVGKGFFLDEALDFCWFDLPQWPLAGRTTEWIAPQRERLLLAVRDHRRRAERAFAAVNPPESL